MLKALDLMLKALEYIFKELDFVLKELYEKHGNILSKDYISKYDTT